MAQEIKLSADDIATLRCDLLEFSKYMFKARKGFDFVENWHHAKICEALERCFIGQYKRLIINIPPRYSKTELAVVNFMAWAIGNYPDCEFIHASYSKRLAANNTYQARAIAMSEEYRAVFGDIGMMPDAKAKDEWRTKTGGCVYATGSDGTITGYGAGKLREGFGGCFPASQIISTPDGELSIYDIIHSGVMEVNSFNENNQVAEVKRITHKWVNPGNDIIRVHFDDGSSFECTPDHEILTDAGWVSAIHLAKPLNLVQRKSGESASLFPAVAPVDGDFYHFLRVLWLCIPPSIRQSIRDATPCLSEFDLPDNPDANSVPGSESFSIIGALEYFNNLYSVEDCSWSSFEHGECSMPQSVLHVVGLSAIREIAKGVIHGVPVQVPNLILMGPFAYKILSDKVSDVFAGDLTANGKVDSQVSFGVNRRLKRSDGTCPSDISSIGNLVKPIGVGDGQPCFVEYIGHVDETYCLGVEDNNNFILSQTGAVVSNCIIIDDPHKASEANSDTMRQNVIDWFQTTMESRLNSPDTPIIVIMQRLHEEDLAGWLQAGGNGEQWHVLSIPAVNPDDTALWPFKHSREKLAEMEASNPYVFAGQYMQRPAPKGGGLFKDSWWQWYDNSFVHPEWDYRVIYADTALKTKEHNDWSVFQCWGFKNGHAYLLDQIRGKWEAPDLIKQARAFWDLHKSPINRGVVRGMKIEDKASGTGLIQTLKMEGVPVIPIQRSVDKFTRALDVLPQIEAGLVHLPKDAPWMPAYIGEFSVFPNGKHDDQVDPTLDAISDNLVTGYNLSAW
ncbi:terminase large subunit [Escherichia phage BUCT618]|nr:terminase large subunit [Escherichia phage BUCT618]